MKHYSLTVPQTKEEDMIGINVMVNSCRKGGPNFESIQLGSKRIIHNYGHNRLGIALSYGSAKYSVSKFIKEHRNSISRNEDIAVLGSGYIGVHTALLLSDAGFNVTIYSQNFPSDKYIFNNSSDKMNSNISPAYFDIQDSLYLGDPKHLRIIEKISMNYFYDLYKKNLPGIRFVPFYLLDLDKEKSIIQKNHPCLKNFERVTISFGQSKPILALRSETLVLDSEIFLPIIMARLRVREISFIKTKFEGIADVLNLPQRYIFNCLGFGSVQVFNDCSIIPVKTIITYYKQKENIDYLLRKYIGDISLELYPKNDVIGIGKIELFSDQNQKEDELAANKLHILVNDFFKRDDLSEPKL